MKIWGTSMRFEGIDCFGLIGAKKIDFLTHVTQYKNNDTVGSNPKLKNYILDGKVCESLVEANNLNLKLENLLNKVDCYNGNSIVEKIKYLIKKIILKLIMWKLRPIFELQIAINKNIYQGLYYQLLNNISQNDVDVCLCDTTNMSFNDCMSTTLIYADYVLHSSKPSILIFCFKEYDTVLMECILADLDELDVHSVFFCRVQNCYIHLRYE
jgi:hypothetical protein